MVSETAGALAGIKAVSPNCTRGQCTSLPYTHGKERNLFANTLDNVVRTIIFLKFQLLNTCRFIIILADCRHENYTKSPLLLTKVQ